MRFGIIQGGAVAQKENPVLYGFETKKLDFL